MGTAHAPSRFARWVQDQNPLREGTTEESRLGRLLVYLSVIIAVAAFSYCGIYVLLGMRLPAAGTGAVTVLSPLTLPLLAKTRSPRVTGHYLAGLAFVALAAVTAGTGGAQSCALAWFLLPPMLAALAAGRRSGVPWVLAGVGFMGFLFLADGASWMPPNELPAWFAPWFELVVPSGLAACAFAIAWSFDVAHDAAMVEVETAREVAERAHASARAVLDHVEQGLVIAGADGRLEAERSAALDQWFDVPAPGAPVWALFEQANPRFALELSLAWAQLAEGLLPRDLLLDQLPTTLEVEGCTFRLRYQPFDEAPDAPILVVVTDVTAELEAAAAKEQQQELLDVFVRMTRDKRPVLDFIEEARGIVEDITRGRTPPELEGRALHTLKGNAGLFGLHGLARFVHRLEDLSTDRAGPLEPEERRALAETWAELETRLAPVLGSDADDTLSVDRSAFEAVVARAEAGAPSEEVARALRLWTWDPVESRLEHLADQARALAERLGRPETQVVVHAAPLHVPPEPAWRAFWSASVHALRNALDHGLEPAPERARLGKPEAGTLCLTAEASPHAVHITYADDGRGIDWSRVAEKARAAGLEAGTHAQLVEALFSDGLSTRSEASELSGRGVGTSALRAACLELGGAVDVVSRPGEGTRFVFTFPNPAPEPQPTGEIPVLPAP